VKVQQNSFIPSFKLIDGPCMALYAIKANDSSPFLPVWW